MKKTIILLSLVLVLLYMGVNNHVHANIESQINNSYSYERIENYDLYYVVDDEGYEDYIVELNYNNETYSFSLLDYTFYTKNNKVNYVAADVTSSFSYSAEFSLVRMKYFRTSIKDYLLEGYIYIGITNEIVFFSIITEYNLPSILNVVNYTIEEYETLIQKNVLLFESVKKNTNQSISTFSSNQELEKVTAIKSNDSFLVTNDKAYEYQVYNDSSENEYGALVYNDSIIEVIPEDYFYSVGKHLVFGEGFGFYLEVSNETDSGDQKKCHLYVFELKIEKPDNETNILIEMIPIFQHSYDAYVNSARNYVEKPETFQVNGEDRVIFKAGGEWPEWALSNYNVATSLTNLETKNINDDGYVISQDDAPRISEVSLVVKNYKSNHTDLSNGINTNSVLNIVSLVNLVTAGKAQMAIDGTLLLIDCLSDAASYVFSETLEDEIVISDKNVTTSNVVNSFIVESFDTIVQSGKSITYTRDYMCGFRKDSSQTIYIGEYSSQKQTIGSYERFHTTISLYGSGSQKAEEYVFVTLNKLNSTLLDVSYEKQIEWVFSANLVYSLTNSADYYSSISGHMETYTNYKTIVVTFVPTSSGIYDISSSNNIASSYTIYDYNTHSVLSSYFSSYHRNNLVYLEANKVYYLCFEGTANSILNFSISSYSGNLYALPISSFTTTIDDYGYCLLTFTISFSMTYEFQTSGTADTSFTLYKKDNIVGYNDDYFYGSTGDDEDENLNFYYKKTLSPGTYYIVIFNNGPSDSITLNISKTTA